MYFFGFVDCSKFINIFYFAFWIQVYKYDKFRTVLNVEKYIHPGGIRYIIPPEKYLIEGFLVSYASDILSLSIM